MSAQFLQTVAYLLTGGFLVFLAITVTRDNFGNRINRITGAMLLFAGLGPVFMALGLMALSTAGGAELRASDLYHLRHLWEFFFPFLVLFSWLFPVDRLSGRGHRWVRTAMFLPPVIHILLVLFANEITAALGIFSVDPNDQGFSRIILQPLDTVFSWIELAIGAARAHESSLFGAIYLVYVAVALFSLEQGARQATNPRIKTQTRWVLWGLRIGLGLFVVAQTGALIAPRWFGDETQSALLVASLLVGSGTLIFATIRHQFLDVQMVFRQSFVNTITSGLLVGLYVVLVVEARQLLAPLFGVQAELVSYGLIVVMLLLFQPINNWLDNLVRSMFIRTRTDHRNVLERFSRQVISVFDPAKLRRTIEETLKTTLLVDRVYFGMYDDALEEYVLLPSEDYPQRFIIDRNDLMLRGINLLSTPTYYRSLTDYREGSDLAAVLEGRVVRMLLPMKDAEHLLGFVALTSKAAGYRYSSEDLNLLGVLSNQMVSALTNARLYVESLERLRLQEEVNMARQIQVDLLPSNPPALSCLQVFSSSTPSRTVGGDFYDFLEMPDSHLGIVIADASGKGMPAALMIAQTQAIIRNEVSNGNPISAMLKRTNQQIALATSAEKYVTLFYGELDPERGIFRYANAGHNYPILVRACGDVEYLKTGGPVIGAFPMMEYESASITLHEDDVLFLFTDGLSEAMDNDEKEFGEARLVELVTGHRHCDAATLGEAVLKEVRAYDPSDPPRDDTTVVVMKMQNGIQTNVR